MRATSAKKSARPSGPTWSRLGAPKPKARSSKKTGRSTSKARRPSSSARRRSSQIEIPVELRRELTALLLLVSAALSGLGLLSWRAGGQGVVVYMGAFLAQMFGMAAWLVPGALGLVAFVLFLGARPRTSNSRGEQRATPRWLSPLVPLGLALLLL